jgi:hypothetical protein
VLEKQISEAREKEDGKDLKKEEKKLAELDELVKADESWVDQVTEKGLEQSLFLF